MGSERRSVPWGRCLVCSLGLGLLAVPAFAPQRARAASAGASEIRQIRCALCKQHVSALAYSPDSGCVWGDSGCRLPE